jgi:IS4 transposase
VLQHRSELGSFRRGRRRCDGREPQRACAVRDALDAAPVAWYLVTSESVDTVEQVEAVVDAYRARWVIEELFKALKTGCNFERRQLESSQSLRIALATFLPIAVQLLALRRAARAEPDGTSKHMGLRSAGRYALSRQLRYSHSSLQAC